MRESSIFGLFLMLFLLGGCGTPPSFYHLYPTVNLKEGSYKMSRRVVGVAEIKLADYIDKEEIVLQKSGNQLEVKEKENWAGDFGKNIQLVIAQDLSRILFKRYFFVALPSEELLNERLRLFITVDRFDANQQGVVTLQGHWNLKNIEKSSTIKSKIFNYTQATGLKLEDIIQTKSLLLERLSRDIAKSIR